MRPVLLVFLFACGPSLRQKVPADDAAMVQIEDVASHLPQPFVIDPLGASNASISDWWGCGGMKYDYNEPGAQASSLSLTTILVRCPNEEMAKGWTATRVALSKEQSDSAPRDDLATWGDEHQCGVATTSPITWCVARKGETVVQFWLYGHALQGPGEVEAIWKDRVATAPSWDPYAR